MLAFFVNFFLYPNIYYRAFLSIFTVQFFAHPSPSDFSASEAIAAALLIRLYLSYIGITQVQFEPNGIKV